MTAQAWVELAALGLAAYATWLSLPRPPQLQWERLFKVGLSIIIAGDVEREHGAADSAAQAIWRQRVLGVIPWHPAGRDADAKLRDPRPEEIGVPALEGERALVDALAALPDPPARYQRMYLEDERAAAELLGDPSELGPDHDPAVILGPDAGWDAVAAWSDGLQQVLARRLGDLVFVADGLAPSLAEGLQSALPGLRLVSLDAPAGDTVEGPAIAELVMAVDAALDADSDRVVFVGAGRAVQRDLAALADSGGLRDRTAAVVSLGGAIQVDGFQAWLHAHFTHDAMDTELRRSIPFISVIDVDPAAPFARSWQAQRFPTPPEIPQGRRPIDPVDLGPLQLAALSDLVLARGLLLFLALRLVSQG